MLRIGFLSNAPFGTSGYATETALVTPRLKVAGHDIVIICNYGLFGGRGEWCGMPMVPRSDADITCRDLIEHYVKEFNLDLVISHWDAWAYPDDFGYAAKRWVPWLPIDRHPLSVIIKQRLKSAYWVLPWCQDAASVLKEGGYENQTVVPLCVDTNNYRILDGLEDESGQVITHTGMKRKFYGDRDAFVVGMVAMNQDTRKNTHRVIRAIGMLKKEIPELRFMFHGYLNSSFGVNVRHLLKQQNIVDISSVTPEDRYNIGLKSSEMAALYNSFDVIALPSAGEGWGLPLTEGNACGCPAVYTNFTSMPEVAYGIGIDPVAMNICREDGSYQAVVKDEDIAAAIYKLWETYSKDPDEWACMRLKARRSAERFDADKVVREHWLPTLAMLEERINSEADVDRYLA